MKRLQDKDVLSSSCSDACEQLKCMVSLYRYHSGQPFLGGSYVSFPSRSHHHHCITLYRRMWIPHSQAGNCSHEPPLSPNNIVQHAKLSSCSDTSKRSYPLPT